MKWGRLILVILGLSVANVSVAVFTIALFYVLFKAVMCVLHGVVL